MSDNVNWYSAKLTDGMAKPTRGYCYVAGTDEQHARKVAVEYHPDGWMKEVVEIHDTDQPERAIRARVRGVGVNVMIKADGTVIRRSDLKE